MYNDLQYDNTYDNMTNVAKVDYRGAAASKNYFQTPFAPLA